MPTTTLGSTMPTSVIKRCVPQQWQDQLIADLDAFQAAEVKEAAHAAEVERLTPDPDHARGCRTADLETKISEAIEEIRARLEEKHQRFRTSTLQKYIVKKYDLKKPPTREVVQRVLRKHGLYT